MFFSKKKLFAIILIIMENIKLAYKPWILWTKFSHILLSIFVILVHFYIVIKLDNKGWFFKSTVPGFSNVVWTFTQFTWWTTILFTLYEIMQFYLIIMFMNNETNIPNRFYKFIISSRLSIWAFSYIFIVMLLFWSGLVYLQVFGLNKPSRTPAGYKGSVLYYIDIITTVFVHFILPAMTLTVFIGILLSGQFQRLKILKELIFGMIYPFIYLIFYFIWAWFFYDPYPISHIRQRDYSNLWILSVVVLAFGLTIFISSLLVDRFNKKIKRKMNIS